MIKFILKKVSKKILSNQDRKNINFFEKINNNKHKLVILDIGGAGGIHPRWSLYKNYIRSIFIEPDERSYIELINSGL